MSLNYRQLAQECVRRADVLLASGCDTDLPYACLEIRQCIEALAYELLANRYQEVENTAFEHWQPRRVMEELQASDPEIHYSRKISITPNNPDGSTEPTIFLGEDQRLPIKYAIKAHNALSTALHVPTYAQSRGGKPRGLSRKSVVAILEKLRSITSSRAFNVNFGQFCLWTCQNCGSPIKRRIGVVPDEATIICGQCGFKFLAIHVEGKGISLAKKMMSWGHDNCSTENQIPESDFKEGMQASCAGCQKLYTVRKQQWSLEPVEDTA